MHVKLQQAVPRRRLGLLKEAKSQIKNAPSVTEAGKEKFLSGGRTNTQEDTEHFPLLFTRIESSVSPLNLHLCS